MNKVLFALRVKKLRALLSNRRNTVSGGTVTHICFCHIWCRSLPRWPTWRSVWWRVLYLNKVVASRHDHKLHDPQLTGFAVCDTVH